MTYAACVIVSCCVIVSWRATLRIPFRESGDGVDPVRTEPSTEALSKPSGRLLLAAICVDHPTAPRPGPDVTSGKCPLTLRRFSLPPR